MKTLPRVMVALLTLVSLSFGCARPETFQAGDMIGAEDGMSILLESARIEGSRLTADFTIDNSHGSKEQVISASSQFSAQDASGSPLEPVTCDHSPIDGKVQAGQKHTGSVCWDNVKEGAPIKIQFNHFPDSPAIVWEASVGK